jgi:signal transduction histidine kinase
VSAAARRLALRALAAARRGHRPELLLAVFVAVNLGGMVVLGAWSAIPFHFVYTAVTILYGIRLWRLRGIVAAVAAVALATAALTLWNVVAGREAAAELVEVPLMSLMVLATAWHVRSRQRAAAEVTRLADEQAALIERERAFFQNVSHDLMTPLTVARGHLELLGRRSTPTPDELAEARRVVIDELRRIELLVGDLLLVGRLESDARLERCTVCARSLVEDVTARWLGVGDRAWSAEIDVDGTLAVDANAVAQALDNVLENALSYTRDGDAIALRATRRRGALRVEVADTGVGIAADVLPHVFDRFYRGDPSRRRSSGGSGLGLAIVRDVVEAHDGTVSVDSAPGAGTRVTIELPGLRAARRVRAPR